MVKEWSQDQMDMTRVSRLWVELVQVAEMGATAVGGMPAAVAAAALPVSPTPSAPFYYRRFLTHNLTLPSPAHRQITFSAAFLIVRSHISPKQSDIYIVQDSRIRHEKCIRY
jgi:hypothetical protein